jgi:hypothetical protein
MTSREIASGIKPRNILGHRAGDQLHILRQIADVAAQCVWRPLTSDRHCRAAPRPTFNGHIPASARTSVDLPQPLGAKDRQPFARAQDRI